MYYWLLDYYKLTIQNQNNSHTATLHNYNEFSISVKNRFVNYLNFFNRTKIYIDFSDTNNPDFFIYIQKINQISKINWFGSVYPKISKSEFFFPDSTSKTGKNYSGIWIQKPDKFYPVSKSEKIYSGFWIQCPE